MLEYDYLKEKERKVRYNERQLTKPDTIRLKLQQQGGRGGGELNMSWLICYADRH